ncbi:hypothetical protein [Gemmatimonas sp.]
MDFDRDTLASAVVGTGGAWLLGSALYYSRSRRFNRVQLKGLLYAGGGFLLSAVAARWLQHTGARGVAISLMGTICAMRGMYLLVRERAALARYRQDRAAGPPQPPAAE